MMVFKTCHKPGQTAAFWYRATICFQAVAPVFVWGAEAGELLMMISFV